MTEAIVNDKEKKQSPLRWLDENFESIFLVIGMLAIIFLITWQVLYRYIFTKFTSGASTHGSCRTRRACSLYFCVDFLFGSASCHQKA